MSGILDKIKSLKTSLGGDNTVLGVDIGSSAIKLVQLKKEDGVVILENYGELALGPYAGFSVGQATNLPTEKISEAFGDLLKEANLTARNAALAIPIGSSLLSFIELPAMEKSQLDKVIPIEARKYIPVPISEVTLNWTVLPKPKQSNASKKEGVKAGVDVLIAAIHNETLSKYERIREQVGLSLNFFEIEIFSSVRSSIGRDMASLMIVDMGAGTTKLAMVEYGVVRKYHVINRGSQDITSILAKSMGVSMDKAEEIKREHGLSGVYEGKKLLDLVSLPLSHIFSEAGNVILNYENDSGKKIDKVVLSGGGALLDGIVDLVKKNFQAEVTLADPFSKIKTPAFLEETLKQAGPEFSVALGVAMKAIQ